MIVKGEYTTADIKLPEEHVELNTFDQIADFVNNKCFTNPIKIMPDCHKGKGSCIGFTMKMGDKIIPNVIGVDIGCGMLTANLGKLENLNLEEINNGIRKVVPLGWNVTDMDNFTSFEDDYPFKDTAFSYDWFKQLCIKLNAKKQHIERSLGSLGGGNHFIELGKDENEEIWLTIHTGSRNLGARVCEYHQLIAQCNSNKLFKEKLEEIKREFPKKQWQNQINRIKRNYRTENKAENRSNIHLIDKEKDDYLLDMEFCQIYSDKNREVILNNILKELGLKSFKTIQSIHNFIDMKDKIIRKGAISAYKKQEVIIPFNMKDGLIIGVGKSNPDWNFSAPHGAGRVLSRTAAKSRLSLLEFKEQMKDIYSTSVCKKTIDEAPNAYKNMDLIKEAMSETVDIIHTVKPILNIKSL